MSQERKKTIDVCYFGAFDPPTVGHMFILLNSLKQIVAIPEQDFKVDQAIVIPTGNHVWGKELAPFNDRFIMLEMMFDQADAPVTISTIEPDFQLSGYTVDSLKELKKQNPDRSYGLVMGGDSIDTFDQWRDWQEILELVYIFVHPRGDVGQLERQKKLPEVLKPYINQRIFFLPDLVHGNEKYLSISSTQAKKELRELGDTGLLTQGVIEYIRDNHLYENK